MCVSSADHTLGSVSTGAGRRKKVGSGQSAFLSVLTQTDWKKADAGAESEGCLGP